MKKILFIGLMFCFLGCDNSYKITKDKLDSSSGLNNGFTLSEIKVSEFNTEGKPSKFEVISTIDYISKHKELGNKKSYKTFYFNKPNGEKGYEWYWSGTLGETSNTLPIKFKNNVWYLMNLSNSCDIDNLYFKFLDDGSVMEYHTSGNCGAAW